MIKNMILLVALVSCTQAPITRNRASTSNDRIEKCVIRLVENSGVTAKQAGETCIGIFRRKFGNIGGK